uniref:Amino acid transporter n=1 Tax=Steinernema glaseri TaxID=37863 RepID=A0A1I7Y9B2_9BILA
MSQQIDYQLQRASLRKSGLVRHQVALHPLLDSLCSTLAKVYRDKQVHITYAVPDQALVPMEQGALLELLGNLLENAYRLCLGQIRISLRVSDTALELCVEDDGPGVPVHQRERILQRGERLDRQYPGQGIGLAVVPIASWEGWAGTLRKIAMTTRQPLYKSLYIQVIIAITIGILLGHFYPDTGVALKPLGDGFVKLIKMVIAPIIFCTVVSGIAGMQSMKSVGKTGGYALLYFEIVSTIALIIGLVVVNVVKPGAGMHIDVTTLNASSVAAYAAAGAQQTTVGFLLNIIPNTVVGAFANGDILQVLMFSVIFGFALHRLGAYGKPLLDLIDRFAHVMFNIINMIMKLAPIGAFGAMAFTIGQYGVGSLVQLGYLMACFYITCLLFILVILGGIARAHGFSVLKLIRYIREELMIVLGTSSSE